MEYELFDFKYSATSVNLTKRKILLKNKKYFIKLDRFYAEIKPMFFEKLDISVRYTEKKFPVLVLIPSTKVILEDTTLLAFLKERCFLNYSE